MNRFALKNHTPAKLPLVANGLVGACKGDRVYFSRYHMQQEGIDKLCALSKLEMSEEERKTLPGQIASVIEYVNKLQELDLPADAPQMAHAVDVVNVWREDVAVNVSEEDRRLLIDAFPETVGELNAVPAVFGNRDEAL